MPLGVLTDQSFELKSGFLLLDGADSDFFREQRRRRGVSVKKFDIRVEIRDQNVADCAVIIGQALRVVVTISQDGEFFAKV